MDTIKPLFTATATATGGRNGHTESDDGMVKAELSVPRAMGGPGKPGTATPEHLFAAGYAACFGSACEFAARQMKLAPQSITVKSAVGIGEATGGGFGLSVELDVELRGVSAADAEKIVAAGHQVCPYSRAIRGNVEVNLKVSAPG
jgi:Ohr subfamily peroxiredoxin